MKKIDNFDWVDIVRSLDTRGFACLGGLLSEAECFEVVKLYNKDELFRSTIDMQRYRFGKGEYRYFTYPLPTIMQTLRESIYSRLQPIANRWMEQLGIEQHFPSAHAEFISLCHEKNQSRPTPLILKYEAGGYNTLHQDIYGDIFFPFQVVFMLTPEEAYGGGELVFVEQLPRAQSRVEVMKPSVGDAVIFTTNFRPVNGSRGYYRAKVKHGVSTLKNGLRYTMGIIFHDAS